MQKIRRNLQYSARAVSIVTVKVLVALGTAVTWQMDSAHASVERTGLKM